MAGAGRIPTEHWWSVPRDPNTGQLNGPVTQVAPGTPRAFLCVQDQIDAWRSTFPSVIDGIYVDVGPMDCLRPGTPAGQASIPANYAQYCQYIGQLGYQVFLLAPQYDDQDPNQPGWLRALPWKFLGLWEEKAVPYRNAFKAWNVGANSYTPWPPGNPDASWWDPVLTGRSVLERSTRVHVINGGARVHLELGWLGKVFPGLQRLVDKVATRNSR
jgi:hypothetical protein